LSKSSLRVEAHRGGRRQSIVARRLFDAERRDEPVRIVRGGLGRRLRRTGLNGRQGMTSESHTGSARGQWVVGRGAL